MSGLTGQELAKELHQDPAVLSRGLGKLAAEVASKTGVMSPAERDGVMRAFRDGAIGVLVSTTVIEVGIDISNATVMVIEHAERARCRGNALRQLEEGKAAQKIDKVC